METDDMRNPYLDVVRVLSWETPPAQGGITELRRRHMARLRTIFTDATVGMDGGDRLRTALRDGILDELLWSPAIGRALLFPNGGVLTGDQLRQLLFHARKPDTTDVSPRTASRSFSLDWGSVESDGPTAIPVDDRDRCLIRVEQALRLVEETVPEAHDIVQTFLRELILRRDPSAPDDPGSYSQPRLVGEAVLINPQADEATIGYLADAIVHESIHSYLFMTEIATGDAMLYEARELESRSVYSPWTGRPLKLRFFVHASFIWYALAGFWRLVLDHGTSMWHTEATRRCAASCKGFRGRKLVDYLSSSGVPPAVRVGIEVLDERARSMLVSGDERQVI